VVRAPRKQLHPARAPSNHDPEPGRVFTIPFGMTGPRIAGMQPYLPRAPSMCVTSDSEDCGTVDPPPLPSTDRVERPAIHHRRLQTSRDSDQLRKRPSSDVVTPIYSHDHNTDLKLDLKPDLKPASLADQYLDTMVMDDVWRAACLEKIRQNQRKHRALKRLNVESEQLPSHHDRSKQPSHGRPTKITKKHTSVVKSKMAPPTPPISPKGQSRKPSSPNGSDSGFVSSSPSPCAPPYVRVRSTRNYPITPPTESISLDIPASMGGRSCLSCGCSNTTCWRRTLGSIICNSCGLRLSHDPSSNIDTRNAVLSVRM
jgi:hypothetical protein